MSNIVNGEFLMDSVVNALKERQKNGVDDQTFFHCLLRKEVGLFKGDEEVYLAEHLTEMFSQVDQILHEKHYVSDGEIMLRVGLPPGYRVIPSRIFATDIPPQFYRQLNCQPVNQEKTKMIYICEAISPIRLSQTILDKYQCITLKIKKDTLSLVSWVPGVDEQAGYAHLNNPLFLIGRHLSKAEKAAEIQRRQALGQYKKPQQKKESNVVESAVLTLADLLK
jgi:hypothetical protein